MGSVMLVIVPHIAHAPTQYMSESKQITWRTFDTVLVSYLVVYHVIYYVGVVVRRQVIKNIWSVRLPEEEEEKNQLRTVNADAYKI